METVLYLSETQRLSNILNSVKNELVKSIRTALVEKAYDTDVQLSFGECIYDIAEGVNRWNAQKYFDEHYRYLEPEYVQESISAAIERRKSR